MRKITEILLTTQVVATMSACLVVGAFASVTEDLRLVDELYTQKDYAQAIVVLNRALESAANDNNDALIRQCKDRLSLTYQLSGDYEKAIPLYKSLASTYRDGACDWYTKISQCYGWQKKTAEANAALESAIAAGILPEDADRLRVAKDTLALSYQSGEKYDKAIALYKALVEENANGACDWYFRMSQCYGGLKRKSDVVDSLEKALGAAVLPEDAVRVGTIKETLGFEYQDAASYSKAVEIYKSLIDEYPEDPCAWYSKIIECCAAEKKYSDVILYSKALLKEANRVESSSFAQLAQANIKIAEDSLLLIAEEVRIKQDCAQLDQEKIWAQYATAGDWDSALGLSQKMVIQYPANGMWRYRVGVALLHGAEYRQALDILTDIIARFPDIAASEEAQGNLKIAQDNVKLIKAAAKIAEDSQSLDGEKMWVQYTAAGDWKNAYNLASSQSIEFPNNIQWKFRLATATLHKDSAAGKSLLDDLILKSPEVSGLAAVTLAEFLMDQGKLADGLAYLNDTKDKDPGYCQTALFGKGELLAKHNDIPGSLEALQKLLTDYPDSSRAYEAAVMIGQIKLNGLNKPDDARQHFKKLADQYPAEKENLNFNLAYCSFAESDYAAAKDLFQQVYDKCADRINRAIALFMIADCQSRMGFTEMARLTFGRVVSEFPEDGIIVGAKARMKNAE